MPTFTAIGGYNLRRIMLVNGQIERQPGWTSTVDALGDNRVALWTPGTVTGLGNRNINSTFGAIHPLSTGSNSGATGAYVNDPSAITYNNTWGRAANLASPGTNPAGNWTYQFYNWGDDNGVAGLDAWYNTATIQFWDNTDTHGTATNLGGSPTIQFSAGANSPHTVKWFKFRLDGAVGGSTYLDIETLWNVNNAPVDASRGNVDTHMGLFRADGTVVASDDDDGMGRYSALSFGNTGPRPISTPPTGSTAWLGSAGVAFNGRDGATLAAGDYWLAVSQFGATYETGFLAFGGSAVLGMGDPFDIRIATNVVPEPGTMIAVIAGLGALAARRRRNRK